MNTLRNELKEKYSQIPNELITDLSLCHGSLRVLLYLFTKPDNWSVYNLDICKQLDISEQTLTKYWKKLLSSKWLTREPSRNDKGHLTGGYTYRIGNFTASIESTESVKSIEHSNNKLINKEETNKRINYDFFINEWNSFCEKYNKSKVLKITDKRKNKIQARHKDFQDFKRVFELGIIKAKESNFLLQNSFFSFDWLIENDTNLVKVLEDKYKGKKQKESLI